VRPHDTAERGGQLHVPGSHGPDHVEQHEHPAENKTAAHTVQKPFPAVQQALQQQAGHQGRIGVSRFGIRRSFTSVTAAETATSTASAGMN
jgi:hypothetical protein